MIHKTYLQSAFELAKICTRGTTKNITLYVHGIKWNGRRIVLFRSMHVVLVEAFLERVKKTHRFKELLVLSERTDTFDFCFRQRQNQETIAACNI